jgi:hypothetical protein
MSHDENRLEDVSLPASPLGPRQPQLPDLAQAEVTHYAYDPQTYEILCRPGQRLTQKKAQRLQELKLYAHVITAPEKHSP